MTTSVNITFKDLTPLQAIKVSAFVHRIRNDNTISSCEENSHKGLKEIQNNESIIKYINDAFESWLKDNNFSYSFRDKYYDAYLSLAYDIRDVMLNIESEDPNDNHDIDVISGLLLDDNNAFYAYSKSLHKHFPKININDFITSIIRTFNSIDERNEEWNNVDMGPVW